MSLEDCESKLVVVFMWKVVEAAFCSRLRAGVSAVMNIVSYRDLNAPNEG